MAKIDKQMQCRLDGLAWALRIIDKEESPEKGIDMLRKEVRFRNIVPVPMKCSAAEVRAANEMLVRRILNALLVVVLKILDEEYGWKKKRLGDFIVKFHRHTVAFEDIDPYGDHYAELSDYATWFNENYDAGFSEEAVAEMVCVERENKQREIRRVQLVAVERILGNKYPEAWEYLRKQLGETA